MFCLVQFHAVVQRHGSLVYRARSRYATVEVNRPLRHRSMMLIAIHGRSIFDLEDGRTHPHHKPGIYPGRHPPLRPPNHGLLDHSHLSRSTPPANTAYTYPIAVYLRYERCTCKLGNNTDGSYLSFPSPSLL